MTNDAVTNAPRRRWTRMGAVAGVALGLTLGGGIAVAGSAPIARQAATPVTTAAEFVGVTPVRVLDTRSTDGGPIGVAAAGPLGQQKSLDVEIAGKYGIPANATSVAVNVTIDDDATLKSFLTVYPTGETRPNASTNNAEPGLVMANSAIFKLGTGGKLTVFNQQGNVNVIVDVTGYFVPGTTLTTDAVSYAPGATVTFTGAGWASTCTNVGLNVFGGESVTIPPIAAVTAGAFTSTFTAPDTPGSYLLVARSLAAPSCEAFTTFVVSAPPA